MRDVRNFLQTPTGGTSAYLETAEQSQLAFTPALVLARHHSPTLATMGAR